MFEVRKSIRQFRDDPAWTFQRKARDYLAEFDRGGYPFSLGPRGNFIRNLARGRLASGRPVSLFHLGAWVRTGGAPSGEHARVFGVAVLELDLVLPATAFTHSGLAYFTKNWSRPALPCPAGTVTVLPLQGPNDRIHRCSTDPAFADAVYTLQLRSLMRTPAFGWRTDNNRLIGWRFGRRPLTQILALAERLNSIADLLSNP
ncbi:MULTISPECIES: hypothetical protein [Streptomycetaceae]|uniref:Uncharacterized protein n=1 Tax=Streptantibioticus cattleyicolor (strain ATCC 35852 / DSM 46488 / JCM 4925 / NBRC 14057 / NRRL 8057) TaxID=1003195 RepID=F8JU18_STREN|nr:MULTISPECIES: hypothetical protein [Streptomycetaceae]AEW93028.1 hypothetical protein SCATT_06570 [Streptantibioticus cattleyicolor NRRL 8057 = DSM 46488]MYS57763.1 hypothetical protein [Streptomyces sp. SID5468]CCB73388.1 protein of unknown function [Streptantibioticus cattleyicolor NRRL 8057 = DSM 46488]